MTHPFVIEMTGRNSLARVVAVIKEGAQTQINHLVAVNFTASLIQGV